MAVNYKIGADASSFKQGVNEAQASLKTLDAALKVNEASFRAGGDAQVYMEQKTQLLTDKMNRQKQLVTQLQAGLQRMKDQGVAPTSVEYQKLETRILNAQTAMNETKVAIDGLDQSQQTATKSAGALADSVNSIGKKISLDQVIGGINTITSTMEKAAGAAVDLGQKIWDNIMNSAKWADDTATQALMYGIDVETFQKQTKVFDTMADMSVDAYYKARTKMQKAVISPSQEQTDIFKALGIQLGEWKDGGKFGPQWQKREWESVFWEFGRNLREAVASGKISQDMADVYSNAIFGKNFLGLNTLFEMGEEGFKGAVDQQTAATAEAIENNAALADSVALLEKNWETFKQQVLGGVTPALTAASDSVSKLLNSLTEYVKSDDGQAMITKLGESVGTLFEDLGKIDPESVVKNFTAVFDKLVGGMQWLANNKDNVIRALAGIVAGWAGLKLTGGALQILQLVNGLRSLRGGSAGAGSGAGAQTGGTGGNGTWFSRVGGTAALKAQELVASIGGLTNVAVIFDYLLNNTYTGQEIRNTGDLFGGLRSGVEHRIATIKENAANFGSDWARVFSNIIPDSVEQVAANPEQSKNSLRKLFEVAINGDNPIPVQTEPEVPENAAEAISKVIGPVTVPVVLSVRNGAGYGGSTGGGTMSLLADIGNGSVGRFGHHANGIWSVPFDGYPAILHAGERVVPAREVSSRNYNSNLYVEKMIMNSGADAQGLADAMASANRRRMSGYGS